MHYSRYRISDFVDLSSSLVDVATTDVSIRRAMADVGYNDQKLGEGKSLFEDFISMTQDHEALMLQKKEVNLQRNQLHSQLKKDYMRVVKIARIAFQDQGAVRVQLALDGEREKNMDAWIDQGMLFCQGLLQDAKCLDEMEKFGVSFASVQSLVVQFDELNAVLTRKATVEARLKFLTSAKKLAMVRFQRWLSNYIKMARIRFDEQPDKLTLLHIKP